MPGLTSQEELPRGAHLAPDPAIKIEEVAQILNVSKATLRRWFCTNQKSVDYKYRRESFPAPRRYRSSGTCYWLRSEIVQFRDDELRAH